MALVEPGGFDLGRAVALPIAAVPGIPNLPPQLFGQQEPVRPASEHFISYLQFAGRIWAFVAHTTHVLPQWVHQSILALPVSISCCSIQDQARRVLAGFPPGSWCKQYLRVRLRSRQFSHAVSSPIMPPILPPG